MAAWNCFVKEGWRGDMGALRERSGDGRRLTSMSVFMDGLLEILWMLS